MTERITEREKRTNAAMIFVAGAVCGIALAVCVFMAFAASGAFANADGSMKGGKPLSVSENIRGRDDPVPDIVFPPEGEDNFEMHYSEVSYSAETGTLDYLLYVSCDAVGKTELTGISCVLYKGSVFKRTFLITDGVVPGEDKWQYAERKFDGRLENIDDDFDTVMFVLTWKSESGNEYGTYTVVRRSLDR